jgi:hypothetical protein
LVEYSNVALVISRTLSVRGMRFFFCFVALVQALAICTWRGIVWAREGYAAETTDIGRVAEGSCVVSLAFLLLTATVAEVRSYRHGHWLFLRSRVVLAHVHIVEA